uniref:NADH-plastoquinone oxidoreductase subunit 4L n=1 Tax=Terniopsis sessilis TaxID=137186 RepID=UPI0028D38813|nr:NADH-plastoquinone oxidoreductase subunit 4L [Terniopsis sessilis]WMV00736.1 NADH-plastoquinone oxidoreductase subunit 4L [Terniopsis sessilis]
MLENVLLLSAFLFSIGIYGLITSRNLIRALMCLELILNAVNLNLVTFSDFFDSRQLKGNIFSIFIITIAAAEAAIGLAIVSSIYRNRKSIRINQSDLLNK